MSNALHRLEPLRLVRTDPFEVAYATPGHPTARRRCCSTAFRRTSTTTTQCPQGERHSGRVRKPPIDQRTHADPGPQRSGRGIRVSHRVRDKDSHSPGLNEHLSDRQIGRHESVVMLIALPVAGPVSGSGGCIRPRQSAGACWGITSEQTGWS